ncbi:putative inactive purple acid phosphatase 24 [Ananas comosus]|uniref:Putative inactive purple acid phosphatase 24 n=1 Tax=Ananas comosus TaxID=4615 RepID=A0A199W6S8_ANACO|nr:putative inactive purple acid phosphatase 24 [Ananas comosus]
MDFVLLFCLLLFSCSFIYLGSSYPITTNYSKDELDRLGISQFRYINRRSLASCNKRNLYLAVNISSNSPLPDEVNVTVTVSGVSSPDKSDWIAMISPSNSSVKGCLLNSVYYIQTGDLSNLPLLCHYPVKAQYMSEDPSYLTCGKKECRKRLAGKCLVETCGGAVTFHVINFRTDVEFVFFAGGFDTPCVLGRSDPVPFANPSMPLNGHLSSLDSTATSMRLTWVSGDNNPQQVQYGEGKTATSQVTTFTQADMCSSSLLPSPAKDFGWHDPGYIHSAVMTGLQPSQTYYYRYGRDYVDSGSVYITPDSGGECGVAYESYFPMPTVSEDKPWYSIEQASVHFTVISTEHDWTSNSEQVDLVFFGHVHNYERTCAVYGGECKGMPKKDKNGVDTYDNSNYTAPVHVVVGTGGFVLDSFSHNPKSWSLSRFSEFGYATVRATRNDLLLEFLSSNTSEVLDRFHIVKPEAK